MVIRAFAGAVSIMIKDPSSSLLTRTRSPDRIPDLVSCSASLLKFSALTFVFRFMIILIISMFFMPESPRYALLALVTFPFAASHILFTDGTSVMATMNVAERLLPSFGLEAISTIQRSKRSTMRLLLLSVRSKPPLLCF